MFCVVIVVEKFTRPMSSPGSLLLFCTA